MAALLADRFRVGPAEFAALTDRQIYDVYLRDRDAEGRLVPPAAPKAATRAAAREQARAAFVAFAVGAAGLTPAEAAARWAAGRNGK